MKTQVFKPYTQNQAMLLPPRLEELIPEGHLVRMVNEMIEMFSTFLCIFILSFFFNLFGEIPG